MIRLIPLALLFLSACGVDGPPIRPSDVPEEEKPATGMLISGSVGLGLGGRL